MLTGKTRYLNSKRKIKPNNASLDGLLHTFVPKRRTLKLEVNEDLVSKEESEDRINFFMMILVVILAIISSILIIKEALDFKEEPRIIKPRFSSQVVDSNHQSRLHVAFIDSDGYVVDFSFAPASNLAVESWRMKLPKSFSYTGFTHHGFLYVIFGDSKKNMVSIKSDQYHRIVEDSQVPANRETNLWFKNREVNVILNARVNSRYSVFFVLILVA